MSSPRICDLAQGLGMHRNSIMRYRRVLAARGQVRARGKLSPSEGARLRLFIQRHRRARR